MGAGVPTDSSFTASGGASIKIEQADGNGCGGGGAGFIYGNGGNSGERPAAFHQYPSTAGRGGTGGGGFKGNGGWSRIPGPVDCGGAGGGFMPAPIGSAGPGSPQSVQPVSYGGAGISGAFQSILNGATASAKNWFHLEDIDGVGGASGQVYRTGDTSTGNFIYAANPGYAGGGGAGQPRFNEAGNQKGLGPMTAGHGGIFGGGGGGTMDGGGGNGGYAGGGGGGSKAIGGPAISGTGGEGIVILYW